MFIDKIDPNVNFQNHFQIPKLQPLLLLYRTISSALSSFFAMTTVRRPYINNRILLQYHITATFFLCGILTIKLGAFLFSN